MARLVVLWLGFSWLAGVAASLVWFSWILPWTFVPGVAFVALVFLGTFAPGLGIHGTSLGRVSTQLPHLALTFDDGPHPEHTRAVLAILAKYGARATFFVIGAKASAHPELLAEMAAAGHQIENHSWDHPRWFALKSAANIEHDLARASDSIERATGRRPRWFRPPFGIASPPVFTGCARADLAVCGWSAAARDGVSWRTAQGALASLQKQLVPGAVVVMHDAAERGARAPCVLEYLDTLLCEVTGRNLKAVTLDELIDVHRLV